MPKKAFGVNFHSISPEQTVERATARLSAWAGRALPAPMDVSLADAPSISIFDAERLDPRFNAWGKGITAAASQASALMELVERLSAETPEFADTGKPMLSSRERLPFRSHGLDTLCAYNFQHALYGDLAGLSGLPLYWSRALSLTWGDEVWIPSSRVWVNFAQPAFQDFCCTNGLSANNTREEAIVQGLCEVIERHTLHLHILNRRQPGLFRIPLDRIGDTGLRDVVDELQEAGWVVVANWHDNGLPFITTSVWMHNPAGGYVYRTDGSHVHFATACTLDASLARCITECVQSMAAERLWRERNPGVTLLPSRNLLEDLEQRLAAEVLPPMPGTSAILGDFREDIEAAVLVLLAKGIEVTVADCTHPGLNIPVVRVICPGLQPNFLLRKHGPDDPMAIVSAHIEDHVAIWRRAREAGDRRG